MPKDGRLGLEGAGGGVCILKIVIAKGDTIFICNFFFGGGGKVLIHHTFLNAPPRLPPGRNKPSVPT